MSIATGVFGLFSARPREPIGEGGRMALADHLRELRARIMRVALVIITLLVAALFFYDQLLAVIYEPYRVATSKLDDVDTIASINGVGGPLLLQLKLSALASVVLSSPYWLYQIWAFILPGLHPNEKKWTRLFAAIAGPMFIAGVAVGYYVLPKGLEVLLDFTPVKLTSIVDFGEYFSFMTRMLLVFGIAFEIPLFVVLLNLAGVISGKTLGKYRPWIIVGTFVFAAVATPSTDPFSMLMLAIPMTLLFFISEIVARIVDRRRGRRDPTAGLSDDEASPIDGDDFRYRRSGLSEDED